MPPPPDAGPVAAPDADRPRFAVVTPSYNQAAFLRETLESVLTQEGLGTAFDLDYAVVDGGSGDGSAEIVREYADRLTWWCSEKDRGQSHAINKGFEHVSRDPSAICAWLNSDDVYRPGALKAVAARWRERPPEVLVGRCRKIDESGAVHVDIKLAEYTLERLLDWHRNFFMQPACFFSRAVWDAVEGLDESLEYAMDVDLWLKMAARFRFETIDADLAEAKAHAEAKTTNFLTRADSFAKIQTVLLAHGGTAQAERHIAELAADYYRLVEEMKAAGRLPVVGLAVRAARRLARRRLDRSPLFRRPDF